jgi:hypothetical protein
MTYWQGGILYDPKGELTDAPELPDIVAFDIADGEFSFYTKDQFEHLVGQYQNELEDDGYDTQNMDFDDIVEAIHGDEFFWDWLPKEVK